MSETDHSLLSILRRIRSWREKAIPDATAGGQLEKLKEECFELQCELGKAEPHPVKVLTEVCDVLIVAANYSDLTGIPLIPVLINKLVRNEARTWRSAGDGMAKHEEEAA